jgi:hypothetical protein
MPDKLGSAAYRADAKGSSCQPVNIPCCARFHQPPTRRQLPERQDELGFPKVSWPELGICDSLTANVPGH